MSESKVKHLPAGWVEGSAAEFLGMSPEEERLMKIRHEIAVAIRGRRKALGLTQAVVAKRMGTGQARVAKIETAHPEVSLDHLIHCLLILGGDLRLTGEEAVANGHHEGMKAEKAPAPTKKAPAARKSPAARAAAKS
jgi:HTH-type transcriptional regulator / antitoxin HipB